MSATVSETYIANLALAEISARSITSLTDTTNEARWCNRFYTQCRDEMLRDHPWNFAMKRAALIENVTEPVNEWAHSYALPADFIRLAQFNAFEADEATELYQIEDGNLLTDEEEASIRYIFQQTDTTKFDPLFVAALSLKLAAKIVKPIAGEDNTSYVAKYELALKKAKRVDSREDKSKTKPPYVDSLLVRSRYSSTLG